MADNRSIRAQVDDIRKTALYDRLKSLSAFAGEDLEGVTFVTARDIHEAFEQPAEFEYDRTFVATTPAAGRVDLQCPGCHQLIPDVLVQLSAVLSKEGDGPSKVKVKATTKAIVHVCGQISVPRPQPEVEGQAEAFPDDDDDEDAEAAAIERLEAAPAVADELDDLLPESTVVNDPPKRGRKLHA